MLSALRGCITGLRLLLCALLIGALVFSTRYRWSVWNNGARSATILEGGAICHYWGRGSTPLRFRRHLHKPGWQHGLNPAQPFQWAPRWGDAPNGFRVAVIPVWMVLLPALAPSAIRGWRRRRRRSHGLCVRCAYDLRGVPDASPCPECGTPRSA